MYQMPRLGKCACQLMNHKQHYSCSNNDHFIIFACTSSGLGCEFVLESCHNSTTYPYLCDTTILRQCTFDHTAKVEFLCNCKLLYKLYTQFLLSPYLIFVTKFETLKLFTNLVIFLCHQ